MTNPVADPKTLVDQIVEATREAKRRTNWASSQGPGLNLVRHDRTAQL
jgi:hypothetical protein